MDDITLNRKVLERAIAALDAGHDAARAEVEAYNLAAQVFRPAVQHCLDSIVASIAASLAELRSALAAQPGEPEMVLVPREPSIGRLMSMAIRNDHGLGVPGFYDALAARGLGVSHALRMEAALRHMRQLYEEATGQGFYRPEREDDYAAMAAPPPGQEKER